MPGWTIKFLLVILAVVKFSVGEIFSRRIFKSCAPNFLFLPKVFDRSGAILIKIVKIFLGDWRFENDFLKITVKHENKK